MLCWLLFLLSVVSIMLEIMVELYLIILDFDLNTQADTQAHDKVDTLNQV